MLKTLYALSEKYKQKNIYIWGFNRDSVNVFTDLAYRGINVCGFVDISERCIGQHFMNRQIVKINTLHMESDIVVIPAEIDKEYLKSKYKQINYLYAKEILDINKDLQDRRIIIYGIGYQGEKIFELLKSNGIEIEAACVTEQIQKIWKRKKVFCVDELQLDSNAAIIIATINQAYREQMLENIRQYDVDKYVVDVLDCLSLTQGDIFQIINKAYIEDREIYLYGNNSEEAKLIEYILKKYDIPLRGKVYKEAIEKYGIEDVYNLVYTTIQNVTVIIAENNSKESENVCEILELMGFSLEEHDYTALFPKASKYKNTMKNMIDSLVGHVVQGNGKMKGYVVYGDEQEAELKILILGASNSVDGFYRVVTWPYRFYQKLQKLGIKAVIYNGAACGYDIVQELLCLLRDGIYLKPDYVISLSGGNDTDRKKNTNNQFCVRDTIEWIHMLAPHEEYYSGISISETLFDFWYRNNKIMKILSELYGAKYYSFLEPMNVAKKKYNLFEISMHERRDLLENITVFRKEAKKEKEGLFINLIDIFDNLTGMYMDYAHYSNKGHEMIANIIFESVINDIQHNRKIL